MEVGAVKQAFNNEVIQLKKNVNQAKIQVIHKLTRKAKTLIEKKAPEHLKDKNKKKAESAVKEVLIIKKLKPRDLARFIITNKAELNTHLNKPIVDNDKACARLLLHKALQQKYKMIKDKFGDIPIKDLLMSRQERLKLKKEAKDAQKNKKKGKGAKVVNSEGDWNVEDVEMGDDSKEIGSEGGSNEDSDDERRDAEADKDDVSNEGSQDISDDDDAPVSRQVVNDSDDDDDDLPVTRQVVNDSDDDDDDDDAPVTRQVVNDSDESSDGEVGNDDGEPFVGSGDSDDDSDSDNDAGYDNDAVMMKEESDNETGESKSQEKVIEKPKFVRPAKQPNSLIAASKTATTNLDIEEVLSTLKPKKKPDKKVKDNKNKNLNEKMMNRKFKKDSAESHIEQKVIDPFFKTASGDNYMSLAEPRQPDEVKEIHRQGNRQERRAAMFGRAPIRPRNNKPNYRSGNDANGKFNKFDGNDRKGKFNDRNSKFNDRDSKFNDSNSKFNGRNGRGSDFNDRNPKFNDRNSNFKDRNSGNDRNSKFSDRNFNNNNAPEPKEEKLHPSWEAKKKQSGILPFKGKKTVFDES